MIEGIKRKMIKSTAIVLVGTVITVLSYHYPPAGICLGAIALAIGGFEFDGLTEEQAQYKTSPWLLPSVGLLLVAFVSLIAMLLDLGRFVVGG